MGGEISTKPGPDSGSGPRSAPSGPLPPEVVREHVRRLRSSGGSYEAIAHAADLAAMTVHAAMNSDTWILPSTAQALLAVTAEDLDVRRIDAGGTRLRLRSLVAMGHSAARLARAADVHHETAQKLIRGETATVSPELRDQVRGVFDAWWDKRPPEASRDERAAAEAARRRAERNDWCCPLALDEEQLDVPGYQPQAGWRPAAGTGVAGDSYPPPRRESHAVLDESGRKKVPTMTAMKKEDIHDGRPTTIGAPRGRGLRERLEEARRAGAEAADVLISGLANAGMSSDQIDASAEYVLAGQHDAPVTPQSVAFYQAYRETTDAYVAELRKTDMPAKNVAPAPARAGQPHPDRSLADRGWQMDKHCVYVRSDPAAAHELEAG